MRTGKLKQQKLTNNLRKTLTFIILIGALVLGFYLPKEDKKKEITVAAGDDTSGIVINYMLKNKKFNGKVLKDIEGLTMNDC